MAIELGRNLSLKAPAKINRFLHITHQLPNGYHALQTVFQFIDLYDDIELTATNAVDIERIGGAANIAPEDDIIIKAARLLQAAYGIEYGARIALQKNIPIGAGLGGGSSDAAAVLLGLNQLWGLNLSQSALMPLALQLGADVPVFVYGQNAWAEGVGDELSAIDLEDEYLLLIKPDIAVSTAQLFSQKALTRDCETLTIRGFQRGQGQNVFEPVARQMHPEIDAAMAELGQYEPAHLTGTGSCIFACFEAECEAFEVAEKLRHHWDCSVHRTLQKSPVIDALHHAQTQ